MSALIKCSCFFFFFFFNDTATTEIYTLSLHDALPIYPQHHDPAVLAVPPGGVQPQHGGQRGRLRPLGGDRKSTRLNSSHLGISYAGFCLKKKKQNPRPRSGQCPMSNVRRIAS